MRPAFCTHLLQVRGVTYVVRMKQMKQVVKGDTGRWRQVRRIAAN
jgi:hypothetical protein